MAIRVTADEVKALFADSDPDADATQIENAIITANGIVDTRLVTALVPGTLTPLPESILLQIEKYLAAHFLALIDKPTARESVAPIGESFQHKVDLGLLVTIYGQQAVLLDATGTLRMMTAVKGKQPSTSSGVGGVSLLGQLG